jgi:hypothetical protein
MIKRHIFTLLISALTFAHIYMATTIQYGSIKGYLPMLFSVSGTAFFLYIFTALPLSLLLNKKIRDLT